MKDTAVPTPGFEIPPYHVESFPGHSPEGWHCVCNAQGFNCLRFPDKPGAKFTTLENATDICERWNTTSNAELCGERSESERAPSAQKPVEQWEATTTYLRRIGDAIELLCSGNRASDEIISAWLDTSLDDFRLQEFACEHGPSWSQGIAVIDAATVLADQPTEGVEHELSPHTTYKAQRDVLLKCLALIEPKLDFSRWENGQGEDIGKEINAAIALVKGDAC